MEKLDGAGFASTGGLVNEQNQIHGDLLVRDEPIPIYERDGRRLQVVGGSILDDGKGLCLDVMDLENGERSREKPLQFHLSSEKVS